VRQWALGVLRRQSVGWSDKVKSDLYLQRRLGLGTQARLCPRVRIALTQPFIESNASYRSSGSEATLSNADTESP
jgi:hypothetical protein